MNTKRQVTTGMSALYEPISKNYALTPRGSKQMTTVPASVSVERPAGRVNAIGSLESKYERLAMEEAERHRRRMKIEAELAAEREAMLRASEEMRRKKMEEELSAVRVEKQNRMEHSVRQFQAEEIRKLEEELDRIRAERMPKIAAATEQLKVESMAELERSMKQRREIMDAEWDAENLDRRATAKHHQEEMIKNAEEKAKCDCEDEAIQAAMQSEMKRVRVQAPADDLRTRMLKDIRARIARQEKSWVIPFEFSEPEEHELYVELLKTNVEVRQHTPYKVTMTEEFERM